MSIDRKLMMGNTDMLLLKLLAQEDMYGYQIIEELRKRSNHVFDMKAGTLYPLLHQLAEKGFLTTYEKNVGEARVRKYYHLTQKGADYLAEREQDWHIFTTAVQGELGGDGCVLA